MLFSPLPLAVWAALVAGQTVQAIALDVNNQDSIKSAAASIAYDMMHYWTGNSTNNTETYGILPAPYFWWEAGAMWGAMINYWHNTGDETYTDSVSKALYSQASPTNDFMMPNQKFDLGNDDQVFWALSAMTAAELQFPLPPLFVAATEWADLATNTFHDLAARWNTTQCNGGMKWQFTPENNGFDYKSSIANGGFFQLAARLYRFTSDPKYLHWATRTWDWMAGVGFLNSTSYVIIDGAGDLAPQNCTVFSQQQWTYNNAIFLYGAAILANSTPSTSPWKSRTAGLLNQASTRFFSPFPNATAIMYEYQCEATNSCNNDQYSFKSYLARWMTATGVVVPSLQPQIRSLLQSTAKAVATSCVPATTGGVSCGAKWYTGAFDGVTGVGQQMAALEVVGGLLAVTRSGPGIRGF